MKTLRVALVAAALGLAGITAPAPGAGATTLAAADFAADCNDDGFVTITEDTKYVGGSADIIGADFFGDPGCRVDLDSAGVDVAFVNVHLRAKGGAFLNIGQASTGQTSIKVQHSTIDMHPALEPGGYLSIKTGCCGGLPGEADTVVVIRNSELRGTWVELGASLAARRGRFELTTSRVEATGDALATVPDIVMRVSVGMFEGFDGQLFADRNVFKAPGGLEAATGTSGVTVMSRNDLGAVGGPIVFTTGVDGRCESFGNAPAVPCT